ncbi:MAG: DUF2784 domain-containing protein [Spirochaetaceae bacterium]|nr:DUF2784 domain-containing protein [Spirochaetaceae bacterium]MDT8296847.1 DUF2784 domain-containing protein [Spirochaetaceae bacterium]
MSPFALAADAIALIHLLYVSFTVGGTVLILVGTLLKWPWIRRRTFRFIHLGAVLVVAAESLLGIWCPLTVWEWQLRARAGQLIETDVSFVGRLIRSIIFVELPDWGFTLLYAGFGVFVILVLVFIRPEQRKPNKGSTDNGESPS